MSFIEGATDMFVHKITALTIKRSPLLLVLNEKQYTSQCLQTREHSQIH